MEEAVNAEVNPLTPKYTGLDHLLYKVGGEGLYQKITFVIFSAQWFCISWLLTGGAFFFHSVVWDCPGSLNQVQCNEWICSLPEDQWKDHISPSFPKAIANSFPTLYACDKDKILTVLSLMVYIGSFCGFFIFPYIADNFGRKIAINIAWATSCLGVILVAASVNVQMIGIGFFLGGCGGNPAITLSYSFINQQSLGKSRQYFSVGIQLSLAVAESIIGIIFQAFNDWRPVSYLLVGIFLLTALSQVYLIETPKFMAKRSLQKTLVIYNTIAKRNSRPTVAMEQLTQAMEEQPSEKVSNSSLIDLFKYKSLRWTNQICGLIFFAIQVVYYSTSFNLDSVGFNPYINQMIVGISQFFGYLFAQIIIPRVKRKPTSVIGMGMSGIFCFVLITVEDGRNKYLSAVLLSAMRFILCAFWAIFYVYQAELFPTKVRSLSLGWSSAVGTVGSTLSPVTVKLAKNTMQISSWIIPGAVAILATLSIMNLRETHDVKLEDDIQEEKIDRRKSQITTENQFN